MGTSKSSPGSPGGVPMVPPWAPPPPKENPEKPEQQDAGEPKDLDTPRPPQMPKNPIPSPIAPLRRFSGAKRSLGEYAKSGSSADMRRGIGKYVKSGLGGKDTATKRFSGTAITAGALNAALLGLKGEYSVPESDSLYPATMKGQSVRKIINTIIETIRPVDGTQDTEASRFSINDALSELLEKYPDADLQNLTDIQREFAIESFVIGDIVRRIELDIGGAIREKAPNVATAMSRLKDVRDFIKSAVTAAFQKLKDAKTENRKSQVAKLVNKVLKDTMYVFEEYA